MKCVSSIIASSLLLAATTIPSTQALKSYLSNIPNGATFTQELGHPNKDDSLFTDFATAFGKVDKTWTPEFCKATFPGSTMTNGEAFGDPCCTWKKGGTPDQTVTAFTTTPSKKTTCAAAATPAPAATTAKPAATTAAPAAATTKPAASTTAETKAPAAETKAPAAETKAPAAETKAPAAGATPAPAAGDKLPTGKGCTIKGGKGKGKSKGKGKGKTKESKSKGSKNIRGSSSGTTTAPKKDSGANQSGY